MKTIASLMLLLCMAASLVACAGAPKLEEGERYFAGEVDFEYAESCIVSYILTADGKSIRDTRLAIKNLSYSIPYKSATVSKTIKKNVSNSSVSFSGVHQIDANGNVTISSREIELRFRVTPDGAAGEMDYSYKTKAGDTPSIDMLIGTYPFATEDRTDSLAAK